MRWSIRYSVHSAAWVIAVSENTKRDLMRLYRVAEERIRVVYEGCGQGGEETVRGGEENRKRETIPPLTAYTQPYLLFIGRLETRKNIVRMIEAFERFKEKTGLPHVLVLAGKPGFGYEKIKDQISKSTYQKAIQEVGYVSESEKWQLLRGADVFLFPSLYEGFGLPVIEAQSVGVPVITSETSSLPEIAGEGALFVDPFDPAALAQAMETLATDPEKRADIIEKATYNVSRFSWATCARRVASLLAKR
jgi:glycosyltransferase involved in cell wall biosynthesis